MVKDFESFWGEFFLFIMRNRSTEYKGIKDMKQRFAAMTETRCVSKTLNLVLKLLYTGFYFTFNQPFQHLTPSIFKFCFIS